MSTRDDQLHDLIAEQAAEWYVAGTEGDLTPQQARDFMRWLRASPLNIAEYLALVPVAGRVAEVAGADSRGLAELLRASGDQIVDLGAAASPRMAADEQSPPCFSPREFRDARSRHLSRERSPLRRVWLGWAAAAVVVAAVAVIGLTVLDRTAVEAPGETFATQHGELRAFKLSDGTSVQLDSDSAITVRFGEAFRKIEVDRGQAYFNVVRDSGRPFRVRAGRSVIRDIGTAFDVDRHAADTTVMVAHGKVQVWDSPDKAMRDRSWWAPLLAKGESGRPVADVVAGQEVTLTSGGQVAALRNVDVPRHLAWRQGRIAFNEQSIAWVAAQFNRYNNVRIEVADPAVAKLQITGVFSAHDVQTFAAFLGSLPGVSVERTGPTITVRAVHSHP